MKFSDLESMCQRASLHTLGKTKVSVTTLALLLSGLFCLFCLSLATNAQPWMALALGFLPLFITPAILMGLGVVLIRSFHDEVKQRDSGIAALFVQSWDAAIRASFIFVPLLLTFLVAWIAEGIFLLVQQLPFIGEIIATLLAFVPFLLNLGAVLLSLTGLYLLFVLTPSMSLKSFAAEGMLEQILVSCRRHVLLRCTMLLVSLLPFLLSCGLLAIAGKVTASVLTSSPNDLQFLIQCFVMMIPMGVILAPSVIFFFNMATETEIYLLKQSTV